MLSVRCLSALQLRILWAFWYILCKGWERSPPFTVHDKTRGFLMLSVFISSARNYPPAARGLESECSTQPTHPLLLMKLVSTHSSCYLRRCFTNRVYRVSTNLLCWTPTPATSHWRLHLTTLSLLCDLTCCHPKSATWTWDKRRACSHTQQHRHQRLALHGYTKQESASGHCGFSVWFYGLQETLQWIWRHLYQTGWRQNFWRA